MHNLVPSAGELNADRGNFSFGEIAGEARKYGNCDFEVDFSRKLAEPRPEIRGDIARAYLYMDEQYGIDLGDTERTLFLNWHRVDPPDSWEIEKARIVERLQGRKQRFVQEN